MRRDQPIGFDADCSLVHAAHLSYKLVMRVVPISSIVGNTYPTVHSTAGAALHVDEVKTYYPTYTYSPK